MGTPKTQFLNKTPVQHKQLIRIAQDLGYTVATADDPHTFFRRKVTKLYNEPVFKAFLDKHTSFLPKTISPIQRWFYYISGDKHPHLCPAPNCSKFIPDYNDKYCCHTCSTKHKDPNNKKTGPKVDFVKKEAAYRKQLKAQQPDYRIVAYGDKRSTFKHSCKRAFEANNYGILAERVACECLHKKLIVHTIDTLTQWHIDNNTGYTPSKLLDNGKEARFVGECGHKFVSRKFYNRRCPKCFSGNSIFATTSFTSEEYMSWLKTNRPDYLLVGAYKDHSTKAKFQHKKCGGVFSMTPNSLTRKEFRCPACAPKTCGTLKDYRIKGKTFRLRGKEAVAVQWMLDNTTIKVESLSFDADKSVPKFSYQETSGKLRKRLYLPDFYVAKRNLIVEVKDTRTSGISGHVFFYNSAEELWLTNCAKAHAVIKAGYKFQLLLFDKSNQRIALPKNWHTFSHKQITVWFKNRNLNT